MKTRDEDDLSWLSSWYSSRCDGVWEQGPEVIRVISVDNPGWWVRIRLSKEPASVQNDRLLLAEGEPPDESPRNVGGKFWIKCQVKSGMFSGAGDPGQLKRIVGCFRELIEGG